jgi:hypothetical protein
VNEDVVHGDGGQSAQLRPAATAVEAYEERELRARVEHVGIPWILAHDLDRMIDRQVARDRLPRAAAVPRAEGQRRQVLRPMGVHGEVRHLGVVVAGLDPADPLTLHGRGKARGQVGPAPAGVLGDPHLAIVGAGPEQPGLHRRLRERVDDTVVLGAAAHRRRLERILRGEVRADDLPALALVGKPEHTVASEVEHAFLMAAADERRVPVEAECGLPLRRLRPQQFHRTAPQVHAVHEARL